jgi:hypothetical protein
MTFLKDMKNGTNIKSISKGIGTGITNVTGGVSNGIKNTLGTSIKSVMPLVNAGESILSSPFTLMALGVVAVVGVSMIAGGTKVASDTVNNPESIREMAQLARSMR